MHDGHPPLAEVFSCARCGDCCRGTGGVVLRQRDSERLAASLGIVVPVFLRRYTETVSGKLRLAARPGGLCALAVAEGCSVHAAKPDICRAWPFFRGNLVDPVSFSLAGEGCPGILKGVSFSLFVSVGVRYLLARGIYRSPGEDGNRCPNALMPEGMLRQMAGWALP